MSADNHYMTTCTYSSTEAAGSKWLQGLLVRTACKQVHKSIQRLQACWQAKRALIVKQPGKGLQVRNACSFEMPAAGPAEAPEAPGTTTNTYSGTSRRTSTRTSTCTYANTTTSACTCAYKHLHVHPLTCLQTLRERQHIPSFCWRLTMSTWRFFDALAP